jgi:hypothetical protein
VKVYIILEHPDMTYYGDADIHGVESTLQAAKAKATELFPDKYHGEDWDTISIQEWEVT